VVVQLSVVLRAPGCLHVMLKSVGGEPQHLLQNCTQTAVMYRQVGGGWVGGWVGGCQKKKGGVSGHLGKGGILHGGFTVLHWGLRYCI
jgi:hypothetical protein